MKIDLVKLVEEVSEEEKIEGGIHKIFALTCLQKLVDMQELAINYTHCCESDSELLLDYTEFLRRELHLNISDTWVESYRQNIK